MPDWEKRVRERIGPRMLTRESVENIIAELSAHLEDGYQDGLSRGLDESEASKRVRSESSGLSWLAKFAAQPLALHAPCLRCGRPSFGKTGESALDRTLDCWIGSLVDLAGGIPRDGTRLQD